AHYARTLKPIATSQAPSKLPRRPTIQAKQSTKTAQVRPADTTLLALSHHWHPPTPSLNCFVLSLSLSSTSTLVVLLQPRLPHSGLTRWHAPCLGLQAPSAHATPPLHLDIPLSMSVLWSSHLRTFLVTFPHPVLHLCFSIGSAHDHKTDATSVRCGSASCNDDKPLISTVALRPLFRLLHVLASPTLPCPVIWSYGYLFTDYGNGWLLSSKSYSTNTVIVQAFSEVVYVTNSFPLSTDHSLTRRFALSRWEVKDLRKTDSETDSDADSGTDSETMNRCQNRSKIRIGQNRSESVPASRAGTRQNRFLNRKQNRVPKHAAQAPKEPARCKAAYLRTKVPKVKAKAAVKQLKKAKKKRRRPTATAAEDSADKGGKVGHQRVVRNRWWADVILLTSVRRKQIFQKQTGIDVQNGVVKVVSDSAPILKSESVPESASEAVSESVFGRSLTSPIVVQGWAALASPFGPSKVSRGASKAFVVITCGMRAKGDGKSAGRPIKTEHAGKQNPAQSEAICR
ncbi:hypothetical protein C8J57DRAFT_1648410, partial [Mycena rebaudengoi]